MADVNSDERAFEHGGAVNSVACSPDGRWLAAGDGAKKLIVRDADTGAEKHAFEHGGGVFSVAFSPDGRWLAAGDDANKVIVRDAAFAKEHSLEVHVPFIQRVFERAAIVPHRRIALQELRVASKIRDSLRRRERTTHVIT